MMVDNGGGQLAWQLDRIAVKNEITTSPHGVSEFQSDDDDEWKKGFFRLSVLTNQSRHHDISTLCNLFYLMIRRNVACVDPVVRQTINQIETSPPIENRVDRRESRVQSVLEDQKRSVTIKRRPLLYKWIHPMAIIIKRQVLIVT